MSYKTFITFCTTTKTFVTEYYVNGFVGSKCIVNNVVSPYWLPKEVKIELIEMFPTCEELKKQLEIQAIKDDALYATVND